MFALESGGELYLKTDLETQAHFTAAGSTPFTYHKQGKAYAMSYWRLPDEALDDTELLGLWTRRAREAAGRSAKPAKKPARKPSSKAG